MCLPEDLSVRAAEVRASVRSAAVEDRSVVRRAAVPGGNEFVRVGLEARRLDVRPVAAVHLRQIAVGDVPRRVGIAAEAAAARVTDGGQVDGVVRLDRHGRVADDRRARLEQHQRRRRDRRLAVGVRSGAERGRVCVGMRVRGQLVADGVHIDVGALQLRVTLEIDLCRARADRDVSVGVRVGAETARVGIARGLSVGVRVSRDRERPAGRQAAVDGRRVRKAEGRGRVRVHAGPEADVARGGDRGHVHVRRAVDRQVAARRQLGAAGHRQRAGARTAGGGARLADRDEPAAAVLARSGVVDERVRRHREVRARVEHRAAVDRQVGRLAVGSGRIGRADVDDAAARPGGRGRRDPVAGRCGDEVARTADPVHQLRAGARRGDVDDEVLRAAALRGQVDALDREVIRAGEVEPAVAGAEPDRGAARGGGDLERAAGCADDVVDAAVGQARDRHVLHERERLREPDTRGALVRRQVDRRDGVRIQVGVRREDVRLVGRARPRVARGADGVAVRRGELDHVVVDLDHVVDPAVREADPRAAARVVDDGLAAGEAGRAPEEDVVRTRVVERVAAAVDVVWRRRRRQLVDVDVARGERRGRPRRVVGDVVAVGEVIRLVDRVPAGDVGLRVDRARAVQGLARVDQLDRLGVDHLHRVERPGDEAAHRRASARSDVEDVVAVVQVARRGHGRARRVHAEGDRVGRRIDERAREGRAELDREQIPGRHDHGVLRSVREPADRGVALVFVGDDVAGLERVPEREGDRVRARVDLGARVERPVGDRIRRLVVRGVDVDRAARGDLRPTADVQRHDGGHVRVRVEAADLDESARVAVRGGVGIDVVLDTEVDVPRDGDDRAAVAEGAVGSGVRRRRRGRGVDADGAALSAVDGRLARVGADRLDGQPGGARVARARAVDAAEEGDARLAVVLGGRVRVADGDHAARRGACDRGSEVAARGADGDDRSGRVDERTRSHVRVRARVPRHVRARGRAGAGKEADRDNLGVRARGVRRAGLDRDRAGAGRGAVELGEGAAGDRGGRQADADPDKADGGRARGGGGRIVADRLHVQQARGGDVSADDGVRVGGAADDSAGARACPREADRESAHVGVGTRVVAAVSLDVDRPGRRHRAVDAGADRSVDLGLRAHHRDGREQRAGKPERARNGGVLGVVELRVDGDGACRRDVRAAAHGGIGAGIARHVGLCECAGRADERDGLDRRGRSGRVLAERLNGERAGIEAAIELGRDGAAGLRRRQHRGEGEQPAAGVLGRRIRRVGSRRGDGDIRAVRGDARGASDVRVGRCARGDLGVAGSDGDRCEQSDRERIRRGGDVVGGRRGDGDVARLRDGAVEAGVRRPVDLRGRQLDRHRAEQRAAGRVGARRRLVRRGRRDHRRAGRRDHRGRADLSARARVARDAGEGAGGVEVDEAADPVRSRRRVGGVGAVRRDRQRVRRHVSVHLGRHRAADQRVRGVDAAVDEAAAAACGFRRRGVGRRLCGGDAHGAAHVDRRVLADRCRVARARRDLGVRIGAGDRADQPDADHARVRLGVVRGVRLDLQAGRVCDVAVEGGAGRPADERGRNHDHDADPERAAAAVGDRVRGVGRRGRLLDDDAGRIHRRRLADLRGRRGARRDRRLDRRTGTRAEAAEREDLRAGFGVVLRGRRDRHRSAVRDVAVELRERGAADLRRRLVHGDRPDDAAGGGVGRRRGGVRPVGGDGDVVLDVRARAHLRGHGGLTRDLRVGARAGEARAADSGEGRRRVGEIRPGCGHAERAARVDGAVDLGEHRAADVRLGREHRGVDDAARIAVDRRDGVVRRALVRVDRDRAGDRDGRVRADRRLADRGRVDRRVRVGTGDAHAERQRDRMRLRGGDVRRDRGDLQRRGAEVTVEVRLGQPADGGGRKLDRHGQEPGEGVAGRSGRRVVHRRREHLGGRACRRDRRGRVDQRLRGRAGGDRGVGGDARARADPAEREDICRCRGGVRRGRLHGQRRGVRDVAGELRGGRASDVGRRQVDGDGAEHAARRRVGGRGGGVGRARRDGDRSGRRQGGGARGPGRHVCLVRDVGQRPGAGEAYSRDSVVGRRRVGGVHAGGRDGDRVRGHGAVGSREDCTAHVRLGGEDRACDGAAPAAVDRRDRVVCCALAGVDVDGARDGDVRIRPDRSLVVGRRADRCVAVPAAAAGAERHEDDVRVRGRLVRRPRADGERRGVDKSVRKRSVEARLREAAGSRGRDHHDDREADRERASVRDRRRMVRRRRQHLHRNARRLDRRGRADERLGRGVGGDLGVGRRAAAGAEQAGREDVRGCIGRVRRRRLDEHRARVVRVAVELGQRGAADLRRRQVHGQRDGEAAGRGVRARRGGVRGSRRHRDRAVREGGRAGACRDVGGARDLCERARAGEVEQAGDAEGLRRRHRRVAAVRVHGQRRRGDRAVDRREHGAGDDRLGLEDAAGDGAAGAATCSRGRRVVAGLYGLDRRAAGEGDVRARADRGLAVGGRCDLGVGGDPDGGERPARSR